MNRHEFLREFRARLGSLPAQEVQEAAEYFEQYLDEAGPESEQALLDEWGSPARLAAPILAEHSIRGAERVRTARRGISAVWQVILAVLASPIALPLAFAAVTVAMALVLALSVVILALGFAGVSLFGGGLLLAVLSIQVFSDGFATGLVAMGYGLVMTGVGGAFLLIILPLAKRCFAALAKRLNKFRLRRRGA